MFAASRKKEQGATGITTVAPYVAGQWGRGNNRLFQRLADPLSRSGQVKIFSYTVK
ncbi:hypothetical protein AB7M49_003020 [Bradyrhizobium elkanii]